MKNYLFSILSLLAITIGAKAQDMVSTPLTLEAINSGNVTFTVTYSLYHDVTLDPIQYQKNGGAWSDYTFGDAISVDAGDKIAFRGNNPSYYGNGTGYESHIASTADVFVYGNVMSLIDAENYSTLKTLTESWNFAYLFCVGLDYDNMRAPITNNTIKSHPQRNLVLPATTLTSGAYYGMFEGCMGLTRAPELPATTLEAQCYAEMFRATGLTKAPALPATEMRDWYWNSETDYSEGTMDCYMAMFQDCTNLTEAPTLPATTIVHGVYQNMFQGCTSLKKAPVLPAAKIADGAYYRMFYGCTSLNYVKCLATDITEDMATEEWMGGVSAGGTFVKADAMTSWPKGDSGIPTDWTVKNDSEEGGDFVAVETPLTFEAIEDATSVTIANPLALTIQYSTNEGNTWTTASDVTITISDINAGQTVQLRGDNEAYGTSSGYTNITFDKDCYVYGNIMSLINSTGFAIATELTKPYTFRTFFYNNKQLKSHPTKDLVLPATTLSVRCYYSTFFGCNGLTRAPQLPATKLANYCYNQMFYGCDALIASPALPATTLADHCYDNMFAHCYGLTQAPELPATTMAEACYRAMFLRCEALKKAPELPATEMAKSCYLGMFYQSGLTAAPVLPATTLAMSCYYQMFQNCTGLTIAPALPATTLADGCYKMMFKGCTNLNEVANLTATTLNESCYEEMFKGCTALVNAPDLAATTLALNCCNYMFAGCTALKKAPKLPATTLATQCYQRMFEGCISLVKAPELPATELAELCYNDMFWECTALKEAPILPATKLVDYCYTMMFFGCSSLEKAPDLPATELTPGCYEHMFMNCNNLNYVKCLATDLGDDTTTDGWLTNVAAIGTFVKADGVDWSTKGTTEGTDFDDPTKPQTFINGIPEGWTIESYKTELLTGDVNDDGAVDISDYIGVANHILGNTPAGFNEKAADVNSDGSIDISDYIGVANIILTGKP